MDHQCHQVLIAPGVGLLGIYAVAWLRKRVGMDRPAPEAMGKHDIPTIPMSKIGVPIEAYLGRMEWNLKIQYSSLLLKTSIFLGCICNNLNKPIASRSW
jgi:hypothetical protein